MHTTVTPSPSCHTRTYKVARNLGIATGPLAVALIVAWGLRRDSLVLLGWRPQMVVMLYMTLLLVTVGSFAVAILARSHAAIAEAFAHGYKIAHAELRLGFRASQLVEVEPARGVERVTDGDGVTLSTVK